MQSFLNKFEHIILDINKYESLTLVGIAALIAAVSPAYLVIKQHLKPINESGKQEQHHGRR